MPLTQAVPVDATLNKDASVSVVLEYTGDGEQSTKETVVLPAGSVLELRTLREEAIRRVANRNAAAGFEVFVKSIIGQPIDLTPPETPEEDAVLKVFQLLRARELDLKVSSADEGASPEAYADAVAERKMAYAAAKDADMRAKFDAVLRRGF